MSLIFFLSVLTVNVRVYHQQSMFEYIFYSVILLVFVCFFQLLISWWYN